MLAQVALRFEAQKLIGSQLGLFVLRSTCDMFSLHLYSELSMSVHLLRCAAQIFDRLPERFCRIRRRPRNNVEQTKTLFDSHAHRCWQRIRNETKAVASSCLFAVMIN